MHDDSSLPARAPSSIQQGPGPAAPAPASSADVARYAAREAQAPGAKNYQGGDSTIVIGASTLTIILAVVLLVVLL